jgi:hypothetical protein
MKQKTKDTTRDLTDHSRRLLVELLAKQDAVFWPARKPSEPWWPHRWEMLWHYHESGLAWRGRGVKRVERSLAALTDAKLISIMRANVKTTQFILTATGDEFARALAGVNSWGDGVASVREIYRFRNHPESTVEGGTTTPWIAETLLNDGRGWGDNNHEELAIIARLALPAMVDGLLESNCDMQGRVYYRLTQSGYAVATKRGRGPTEPAGLPELLEDGRDLYFSAWNRALSELKSLNKRTSSIGEIPLPVSMELKCHMEDDE